MNLELARAAIEKAPHTHLGAAAKFILQLLNDADLERLHAMERQQAVMAATIARLTKQLEPLEKLQALEKAVREVVGGHPPGSAYGRAILRKVADHLTPHLP